VFIRTTGKTQKQIVADMARAMRKGRAAKGNAALATNQMTSSGVAALVETP
jgi:hypothetical protein